MIRSLKNSFFLFSKWNLQYINFNLVVNLSSRFLLPNAVNEYFYNYKKLCTFKYPELGFSNNNFSFFNAYGSIYPLSVVPKNYKNYSISSILVIDKILIYKYKLISKFQNLYDMRSFSFFDNLKKNNIYFYLSYHLGNSILFNNILLNFKLSKDNVKLLTIPTDRLSKKKSIYSMFFKTIITKNSKILFKKKSLVYYQLKTCLTNIKSRQTSYANYLFLVKINAEAELVVFTKTVALTKFVNSDCIFFNNKFSRGLFNKIYKFSVNPNYGNVANPYFYSFFLDVNYSVSSFIFKVSYIYKPGFFNFIGNASSFVNSIFFYIKQNRLNLFFQKSWLDRGYFFPLEVPLYKFFFLYYSNFFYNFFETNSFFDYSSLYTKYSATPSVMFRNIGLSKKFGYGSTVKKKIFENSLFKNALVYRKEVLSLDKSAVLDAAVSSNTNYFYSWNRLTCKFLKKKKAMALLLVYKKYRKSITKIISRRSRFLPKYRIRKVRRFLFKKNRRYHIRLFRSLSTMLTVESFSVLTASIIDLSRLNNKRLLSLLSFTNIFDCFFFLKKNELSSFFFKKNYNIMRSTNFLLDINQISDFCITKKRNEVGFSRYFGLPVRLFYFSFFTFFFKQVQFSNYFRNNNDVSYYLYGNFTLNNYNSFLPNRHDTLSYIYVYSKLPTLEFIKNRKIKLFFNKSSLHLLDYSFIHNFLLKKKNLTKKLRVYLLRKKCSIASIKSIKNWKIRLSAKRRALRESKLLFFFKKFLVTRRFLTDIVLFDVFDYARRIKFNLTKLNSKMLFFFNRFSDFSDLIFYNNVSTSFTIKKIDSFLDLGSRDDSSSSFKRSTLYSRKTLLNTGGLALPLVKNLTLRLNNFNIFNKVRGRLLTTYMAGQRRSKLSFKVSNFFYNFLNSKKSNKPTNLNFLFDRFTVSKLRSHFFFTKKRSFSSPLKFKRLAINKLFNPITFLQNSFKKHKWGSLVYEKSMHRLSSHSRYAANGREDIKDDLDLLLNSSKFIRDSSKKDYVFKINKSNKLQSLFLKNKFYFLKNKNIIQENFLSIRSKSVGAQRSTGDDLIKKDNILFRMKPGYSVLWRQYRKEHRILTSLSYYRQNRLTDYFLNFKRNSSLSVLKSFEFSLFSILKRSGFFYDFALSNFFIKFDMVFVNGTVIRNRFFQLYAGDRLQLVLNYKVMFQFKLQFTSMYFFRIKFLSKYIKSFFLNDVDSQARSRLVRYSKKWYKKLIGFCGDIPNYLEVDFMTMTSTIVYEPFLSCEFDATIVYRLPYQSMRLYNWKYVN